jgi:SulP family sulfate permease
VTARRYPIAYLAPDVIAGLTLWAVFAAQALAYSRLAHASATAGLVTAIAGALVYTLLGSSRRISIGPAGGIAAIVGAAVAGVPAEQLGPALALLTLMTGGFLCLGGLLRLSFVTRLFPTPVFVGYLAGTGITIMIGQGRELLAGGLTLGIGLAAIFGVLLLKRVAPRVPGPFVVLALATVASVVLDLAGMGVPVIGTSLGHFSAPSLPHDVSWSLVRAMIPPALGLALIVFVDAQANAGMLAQRDDPPVSPRRDYLALGATSLVSGLVGGFVAGTSSSRSIVGIRAGEKTRLAGLVAGVLLVLTALSVVRFLEPMPLPALAGVVFVAAIGLIDVRRIGAFFRLRRADFWIACLAGAAVVFVGMVEGIVVGVAAALVEAFRRAMYPNRSIVSGRVADRYYEPFTDEVIEASQPTLVYRFGAGLFFGNAEAFLDDMRRIAHHANPALRSVVVNADALGVPDATAKDFLVTARTELERRGIALVFGNVRRAVREALERIGGFAIIDEQQFLATVRQARGA